MTSQPRTRTVSLRLRLSLLVAIVVTLVVAAEAFLEIRTFERSVRDDLLQGAGATAQAVADDVELRSRPKQLSEVPALLHDFLEGTPAVRDIAVLLNDDRGDLSLLARTVPREADDVLPAAMAAVTTGRKAILGEQAQRVIAVPIVRRRRTIGAVAVTVSLAAVEQLSTRGRAVTLWFAVPAVLVISALVTLLTRRLVHRPIETIRRTMERAGAGELGARATVGRPDELGQIAGGLNDMLARLEQLQTGLQERVDDATQELRETNARLVESYQRVLALREDLARAEQMAALGQMAANVAHQIGTPLNLVSGYVQLLAEELDSDPRILRRLHIVETQIRRVTDAIRNMLDSARRPALERQTVDVEALVQQVCEVSRPALHAAGVDLQVRVEGELSTAFVDPVQLELALLNLISNSLDAMPDGGRLDITLAAPAGALRITVADSGTGIAPDVLPRVFEPWVTTKAAGRGSGLGLSITRAAIASHGGTIDVSSESGRGTTFTIELPRADTPEGPPQVWTAS